MGKRERDGGWGGDREKEREGEETERGGEREREEEREREGEKEEEGRERRGEGGRERSTFFIQQSAPRSLLSLLKKPQTSDAGGAPSGTGSRKGDNTQLALPAPHVDIKYKENRLPGVCMCMCVCVCVCVCTRAPFEMYQVGVTEKGGQVI